MPAPRITDSLTRTQYTVRDTDLNGYRLLHGGRLLTLADETGFLAAHRFCGLDCLTVAVHRARFHLPAALGDTVLLEAKVALTGRSSLWVPVGISNSAQQCLMDAVFVYAAVDADRRPAPVAQVAAVSPAEMELQQQMQQLKASIKGEPR